MKKLLATILALVMALGLCTSAWATGEAGTGEGTGATAGAETGGTGANGTEGGETGNEENGGQATTYVAQIGETTYETLAAAIKAAKSGATVTLQADTHENVTISTRNLTLDLNGHTLNGGTVAGKPALTVTARGVTVKDSSEGKTGTIMREDTAENSGVSSHYVIDVQGNGWLTFESGIVKNNSGNTEGKGASLVRVGDDSVAKYPGLNIKGGTFTQDNFIVIKVDSGKLSLNGGTLNSANSYAIEDWHWATVKGGTVNGTVAAWTYNGGHNSDLSIEGGTIKGNVASVSYDKTEGKLAKVSITGGTVTGELGTYTYNNGLVTIDDATKATIKVSGGTFDNAVEARYCDEGYTPVQNSDGKYGVQQQVLAKIGDTAYYTMDEAFHAVQAGETIVMQRDYTTGAEQYSGNKSFAIDLNGKTWTYTGTNTNHAAFEINYPNVTLTVKNGTVASNSMVGLIPSAMGVGGPITYDNAGLVFENVTMTAKGYSGIETNGNNTSDTVTLKNSTLNVPNGFGIYFPSSGKLAIENSTINAKTMGVQVCAGSLEITGESAITVTGDAVPKTENDGAIQDGAAISIVNRTGYKGLSDVTVTGGTFTAKAGNDAIKAYNWANNTETEFTAKDNVAVTGGTFSSQVPSEYVAADKRVRVDNANSYTIVTNGSITSGTYTEEPTVAPGYKAVKNDDNTWRVERTSSGGYYYYGPSITAVLNGTNKSATDYPGGDYGLVFRSTAAFSTFRGVQVDGKTLAKSNYTAEEGSTVVYLKAAYLKTLAAGKHTITILSTAGNTSMDFTIGGKSSSPKTFDAGVGIYAVTAVLSMTGMAWTAKKRH